MRPAGPLPRTNCSSMPRSHAWRRTAGDAIGLSPLSRAADATCAAGLIGVGSASFCGAGGGGAGTATASFGTAAGALRTLPVPSTSMRISSDPTAITLPISPPSDCTVPTTGDGISTVALSVITSASTWSSATVSPGFTCHATSSTSAMPSPMSGMRITCTPISCLHRALERSGDARRAGEIGPLLRMRIGRVPTRDAFDRRLEVIEAMLLHQRLELGTEAAGARGLVHDDAATGLLHRVDDRREVERPQAAQVDDLGIDAGVERRRFRHEDHRAVGDHRQI